MLFEIITGNADVMMILVYLVVRDRLMHQAILQLAEETAGVDRDAVENKLKVLGGD